ncbi:related to Vacuolar protein sorting-associated protein VPS5 [Sporisorium scitamineum]|uniref:Related to Vacuolar protein sorting-associated protein VPS5 n=1 Tax=Sporisorium scitamineum TaxID=49012 RepID=A0A127Z5A0_9BASI|nr:related to Vacuolar protein sorting-associated protein VPS5 [Sporisorium scitamineum]
MTIKVLITGASGLLGRAVHQQCIDKGYDTKALAFSRSDPAKQLVKLDLADAVAVESCLREFNPDVIVHTAAERRPDVVEKDPTASHAINVEAPASIATIASQLDKVPLLINISTDYVFDGSKPPYKVDDAPNPLNAYGVSKLQGERAVEEHAKPGHFTNLRVPVLYGKAITNDESAVNILIDAIQPPSGSTAPKKCDAYAVRYPTNVADVARAILKLAEVYAVTSNPVPPTTHFSAKEAMTKYDMCMVLSRIANSVGFETRTDHLDPEYEVDPMAATARPRHCKLDTSVLEGYGVPVEYTSFEDWWRPYLAELHKAKLEEEARLAAEAEARHQKEEKERRQREAEEQAERQHKLEEEKRIAAEQAEAQAKAEAEAQRKAEDEAERKREAEEAAAAAAAADPAAAPAQSDAPPSSEIGEAPNGIDHEPGSPHPSFNSLQARPTPPATSGLPSPTSSHPPSSIKSGFRPDTPPLPLGTKDATSAAQSAVTIATTDATPTGSIVEESPLNLAAARERQRLGSTLPQRSLSASSAARLTSLTDESTMFGGTARKSSLSGPAYLDTASGALSRHAGSDSDDDGYGQPSPRKDQVAFPDRVQSGSPTPAGRTFPDSNVTLTGVQTGSVASLGSSAPSRISAEGERGAAHGDGVVVAAAPTTQPRLYHRPSFDQLQDARDREAYERLHRRNWTFTIKVGDPQRIGDPMTAHIVYTVRVQTDCPAFRSQHFSSLRRYRDFRWLHAALVQNNPGIIVPPVPEKVSIGRFAAELVEARRIGLETCINKIANHPLLQQDDDFRLFLESENFAADVKQRDMIKGPIVTPEQKTYKSWGSALLGSVVPSTSSLSSGALSAYSFEETDEWFNEQKIYLDSLENALKGMVKSVSALSNQRKQMVQATHDLAQVLTTLSGSSLSRSLSTCFAGLAEVKRRAMELEDLQAEADVRQLGTTMYEYERVVGSVRKAFKVRTEVWAKSARQADELRKTRARFDKYKAANPSSAGPQFQSLLAEVTEAETKSLDAQRLFDTVSHRCKDEMERLDLERVLDFKRVVGEWLTDMIARQEEVVEEWVRYCELLGRQTGVQILPSAAGQGQGQGDDVEGQQSQPQPQQQQPQQQPPLSGSQSHASNVADTSSTASAVEAADQGQESKTQVQDEAKPPQDDEAPSQTEDVVTVTSAHDATHEDAPTATTVTPETPSQPADKEESVGKTTEDKVVDGAAASDPTTTAAQTENDTSKAVDKETSAAADAVTDVAPTADAKLGEPEVEHSSP